MTDTSHPIPGDLGARLERIEATLRLLVQERTVRDFYSTAEVAQRLGKAEFTIREYCRLRRIHAEKKTSGRGRHSAWVISHQELLRLERHGLLPLHDDDDPRMRKGGK